MARYTKSGTVNTVQEINSELEKIAGAQQDFVSRIGESANAMNSLLDMNNERIINLPPPVNASDPLRLQDLQSGLAVPISEASVVGSTSVLSATSFNSGDFVITKGYYPNLPYGRGSYQVLTPAEYETFTGLLVGDGYRDHTLPNGNIAMLLPENGVIGVQQCGAVPYDNTKPVADANTESFRYAHLSYTTEWDARKAAVTPVTWATKVESGDYNLSNGYAIADGGVSFSDSLGSSRVKVLKATEDLVNPKLALISMGKSITGTAVVGASGLYVDAPPPRVYNLYVNPQNTGTAVDVTSVQGFSIGDLWIQAEVGINIGDNSSDGIIGKIFVEDSTGAGIVLRQCQNVIISEVYTFLCNYGIRIIGTPNNIDIGILQANYTFFAPFEVFSGSPKNIKIGQFTCNQNEQFFDKFQAPLWINAPVCDIRIDHFEAYNYDGYALFANGTGGATLKVDIGTMVLKQVISGTDYTQGTTARGIFNRGSVIRVQKLIAQGLEETSIGYMTGVQPVLTIDSAIVSGQVGANELVFIDPAITAQGTLTLKNIDNQTTRPLFIPQENVTVRFRTCRNPFPIIEENSRKAVKIPINAGGMYEFTIRASTVGGDARFDKVAKFLAGVDVSFNGANLVWNSSIATQLSNATNAGSVPEIALQVDVGAVGTGADVLRGSETEANYLTLSVPNTYIVISYTLQPSES